MIAWLSRAPLRVRALAVYAGSLLALIVISLAARHPLELSVGHVWKAATTFGIVACLGIWFLNASHPFARFGAANIVTTARAGIVSLIVGLVGEPGPGPQMLAAIGGVLAMLLDGVDGYLARRNRMESAFGARFDMETDALLILALSLLTWQHGKAGAWILLAGLLRYLFVVATLIVPRMQRPLLSSRRRQVVCVVQIVGLSLVVLPWISPPASVWIGGLLLALLVWSFAVDIIWLCRSQSRLLNATP
jgi:phosphatidylglycerophosphate synthase